PPQQQPQQAWQQQVQPQQQPQHFPQQQAQPHFPQQQGGGAQPAQAAAPGYGDRSPTTFHQIDVGRVMRIGRALENELVVSDLQVSRNHAEFRSTGGRFEIHDLGSHNGTYVNGQPLPKSG